MPQARTSQEVRSHSTTLAQAQLQSSHQDSFSEMISMINFQVHQASCAYPMSDHSHFGPFTYDKYIVFCLVSQLGNTRFLK